MLLFSSIRLKLLVTNVTLIALLDFEPFPLSIDVRMVDSPVFLHGFQIYELSEAE